MTWKIRTKVGTFCSESGSTYHHLDEIGRCRCGIAVSINHVSRHVSKLEVRRLSRLARIMAYKPEP